MINLAREPLRVEVEIDDTWVGGTQAGIRGSRQLKGRRAAFGLVPVEKRGKASGRLRMVVIPDFKANTINRFLTQNVASGATIYTDGLKTFTGLEERRRQPMAAFQTLLGLGTLLILRPWSNGFRLRIALNATRTSKRSDLQSQLLVFSAGIGIGILSGWLRTTGGIRGQSAAGF